MHHWISPRLITRRLHRLLINKRTQDDAQHRMMLPWSACGSSFTHTRHHWAQNKQEERDAATFWKLGRPQHGQWLKPDHLETT